MVKTFLCGFEGANREASESKASEPAQHNISGDNSLRDPPVPIPNTEVKPQHADGTWLATARESRSSPDSMKRRSFERLFFLLLNGSDATRRAFLRMRGGAGRARKG